MCFQNHHHQDLWVGDFGERKEFDDDEDNYTKHFRLCDFFGPKITFGPVWILDQTEQQTEKENKKKNLPGRISSMMMMMICDFNIFSSSDDYRLDLDLKNFQKKGFFSLLLGRNTLANQSIDQ